MAQWVLAFIIAGFVLFVVPVLKANAQTPGRTDERVAFERGRRAALEDKALRDAYEQGYKDALESP